MNMSQKQVHLNSGAVRQFRPVSSCLSSLVRAIGLGVVACSLFSISELNGLAFFRISSPLTTYGDRGQPFSYTIVGYGWDNTRGLLTGTAFWIFPPLPPGLSSGNPLVGPSSSPVFQGADPVISGTPVTNGTFQVLVASGTPGFYADARITFIISTGEPVITSPLSAIAVQGKPFSYAIGTKNTPSGFAVYGLPAGLYFDAPVRTIAGTPTAYGVFQVGITVTNSYGSVSNALALTIASGAPVITSPLTASGKQGVPFTYPITTSNSPTAITANGLPKGLIVNSTNWAITGIPSESGSFALEITATNQWGSDRRTLTLTLASGAPRITGILSTSGKQGQAFSYTITASNSPTSYSAGGLPGGLGVNSTNGIISGTPVVSGSFSVVMGVANQWGFDSVPLTLTIASAVPAITSALTKAGTENASLSYTITASESPTSFGATGLPTGLTVNPTTGSITGTPMYGGTFAVGLWAQNAWGTGSNTLTLTLAYAPITGLSISEVTYDYSSPYLLDFEFALRDNTNATLGHAVVRPATQLQVVCRENGVAISPTETAFIVEKGDKKTLKCALVLDYTASMYAAAGAISNMEASAKAFINQQPAQAQFELYEFHADWIDPNRVSRFMTDKAALGRAIDGILPNYVQGWYAGTRCWDALFAALADFGPANRDEQRYLVFMSDGNDESSVSSTNGVLNALVSAAMTSGVKLYCLAFGSSINTTALQQLTEQTRGRYYVAATAGDLSAQFAQIGKDIDGQYLLRWASLKRSASPVRPSFEVTVAGYTAAWNTNTSLASQVPDFTPSAYGPSLAVLVGGLRLLADADEGPKTLTLRATYVPRYVRKVRVHYRPNYPCTVALKSNGTGEILNGWSLTETNDGAGGRWLEIVSPNPTNQFASLPYGVMGDLVTFQFRDLPSGQQAFSLFAPDNSVYASMPPSGQSFVMENTNQFVTVYPVTPLGTPVPWLMANGFTNNFAAAELSDPDGDKVPTWQEYMAGTNPRDPNSKFVVRSLTQSTASGPFQLKFSTVIGRTYRVEAATSLGSWQVLQAGIAGSGGDVTVTDNRNLSGVSAVFYRVVVY